MDRGLQLKELRRLIIVINLKLLTRKGLNDLGFVRVRGDVKKAIAAIKSGTAKQDFDTLIEKVKSMLTVKPLVETEVDAKFEDINMDLFAAENAQNMEEKDG